MARLYEEHRLPYIKCEPNELEDLILSHPLDDSTLLPILVINQVYKSFVPLDYAIVMVLPEDIIENKQ